MPLFSNDIWKHLVAGTRMGNALNEAANDSSSSGKGTTSKPGEAHDNHSGSAEDGAQPRGAPVDSQPPGAAQHDANFSGGIDEHPASRASTMESSNVQPHGAPIDSQQASEAPHGTDFSGGLDEHTSSGPFTIESIERDAAGGASSGGPEMELVDESETESGDNNVESEKGGGEDRDSTSTLSAGSHNTVEHGVTDRDDTVSASGAGDAAQRDQTHSQHLAIPHSEQALEDVESSLAQQTAETQPQDEFEVEEILEARITRRGRVLQFRCRWRDYPDDSAWYNADDGEFNNARDVVNEFYEKLPGCLAIRKPHGW